MNMYNMIHGTNPGTFYLFPTLGFGHPDSFPRFRDCYLSEDKTMIEVYCRMGGGNYGCWDQDNDDYEEETCNCIACKLKNHYEKSPLFVSKQEDDFDCTYMTLKFKIHEKFADDVKKINEGRFSETSKEYQDLIKETFPKIKDKIEKSFVKCVLDDGGQDE